MNIEILINEVYRRPSLWDKKDKSHHNRFVLDKLWNEVAQKMHTKPTTVRHKWKSLRDKFRTTLASIPGDVRDGTYKVEWRHFQNLLFLKNQFIPKDSSGNVGETIMKCIFAADDDNDDHAGELTGQANIGPSEYTSIGMIASPLSRASNSPVTHRKTSREGIGNALIEIEKQKLLYLQQKRAKKEEDDDDLSFFKSLLPHVRSLSAYEKLEYRMKVMKITQEYIKHEPNSSSSIPP